MKRVAIISYYWPPSGGAGVQRWVKLSKYLSKHDVECHVISVKPEKSSYQEWDQSLLAEVSSKVHVHLTDSWEPTNIYAKLAGKKAVPSAGFSNVNNDSLKQKLVNGIRSNFFIPDPRIGWVNYAIKETERVIKKYNIKTIITTSPPHSTQLVGLRLKRKLGVHWISDLRDPWTDIYYYSLLNHSRWSHKKNLRLEREVLVEADKIVTVSDSLANDFAKVTGVAKDKVITISNGFDQDDFNLTSWKKPDVFTITYTGTMSDIYEPDVFFKALASVQKSVKEGIKINIIGSISDKIYSSFENLGLNINFIPTVPHSEIVKFQVEAHLLLLVIPNTEKQNGIVTGKIFEYLASQNRIICIGPESGDAAKIISSCNLGNTFERDSEDEIVQQLLIELDYFYSRKDTPLPQLNNITHYSRENQALEINKLIV